MHFISVLFFLSLRVPKRISWKCVFVKCIFSELCWTKSWQQIASHIFVKTMCSVILFLFVWSVILEYLIYTNFKEYEIVFLNFVRFIFTYYTLYFCLIKTEQRTIQAACTVFRKTAHCAVASPAQLWNLIFYSACYAKHFLEELCVLHDELGNL